MNIRNIRWQWVLLPLFLLAAIGMLDLLGTYTHSGRNLLVLTPVFQDNKGWDIYTLTGEKRNALTGQELLDVPFDETFYLSRTLTEDMEAEGYTFLFLDSQLPASVFLNGILLYTTCPDSGSVIGQISFPSNYIGLIQRGERVRCTLPAGYAGKTLTIATTHRNYASMPGIFLSSEATESEIWMSTANLNTMPAAAFAMGALLLLGLLFYTFFQGRRDFSLLPLTAAAFAQLFYYLRQYAYSAPASTALDIPLAYSLLPLLVILPELFLVLQMKRWRKLGALFILIPAAISLIPPAAYFCGLLTFSDIPFFETLYIGLAVLLVLAVLEARDKNYIFRLFWGGLGAVCACILTLCLVSSFQTGYYTAYFKTVFTAALRHLPQLLLYWSGIILFVLSAVISVAVLIRNTADVRTKLALQAERLNQLNHDLSVQKQFYEAKLTSEDELRALRHDMRGHLSTLDTLLSEGNTDEAIRYLESLENLHRERQTEIFSSNAYMNAVLSTFNSRFRENRIAFTCCIGTEGWALPGMEICLILNNALENALEASLLMPLTERSVKIQAAVRKKQLLFRISNRFDGNIQTKNGLPVTSKTKKGHGYGLANIRSTAEHLGGEMIYRTEDGYFVLDVRLPLSEDIGNCEVFRWKRENE